jgi:hypothetical protein
LRGPLYTRHLIVPRGAQPQMNVRLPSEFAEH